ncbi:hypothetical protein J7E83_01955 [Arthrobacter sp. ISL-48]|uniref:hypothetical protein n=1 Tax=Arthrobacter sp. ISL-48 TaxID=2819110 RepID=UPI001BEA155F|nr:hypothetical protein [Arthrobacter sp. ISL-48]MBT2530906.1 hypothetical protein [Arthrobacter sp. ISL-48]
MAAPSVLASDVAPEGDSALGPALDPGQGTLAAFVAGVPLPTDDAGAPGSDSRFGFAPARDLPGSGARPAAMRGPSVPFDVPAPQDSPRISALPAHAGHGHSVSSGGSGSGDIAELWPGLPATTGAIIPPLIAALPAGPSFDPGSSPD